MFACVSCSSFSAFQAALDKAAQDLKKIDQASADKFRSTAGDPQEDPTTQPPPSTTKKCRGWFSSKCDEVTTTTTVPTTAAPTTAALTTAAPTTAAPVSAAPACGGWFQPACEDSSLSQTVTTTAAPTTEAPTTSAPSTAAPACGGWFQPACEDSSLSQTVSTTAAPTTEAPTTAPVACGGWFQPACEVSPLSQADPTTSAPSTEAPTTPGQSCGGWFQSACEEPTTTPEPAVTTPQSCGGWFQSACETTPAPTAAALSQSCGWFSSCVDLTSPSTTPAPSGWISSIVTSLYGTVDTVKSTAGKAVGTALDVTSKIATASMNGGVDFFLNQIKLVVTTTNMDTVPLPDLDIPLYPGASLKASGGYFKKVSSISRGGDIVISRDGLAFILDFPVQLSDMEIGFKEYSITVFMGAGTSGDIKVGVANNKINIRIRLAISTSCAINVEKVDFAVLDGLDIQMSYGCSLCGYITDKASSYLANFLKNTIRLQIQGQIDSILKQTLSENSLICSKFMGV